ncbi:uncharacterized protein LOC110250706 [Exaiptasia diaphana]|uniref:Death domain-containing protein n=1 Tax=Exaiptasia diaphana TaxID=2652724 RepID=A0A913YVC3_EXADI|nr:uncharacterized protein LOC110250706 [Exaiptasia diaphana]
MKDLIQTNSTVKDCLKNGLDYDYKLLSNWRHLADQLKDPAVPQEVKEACESGTIHSPTLEVLGRPDICIKPVQELMDKLNGNGLNRRCDVHLQLSNGIPEADRSKSIEDVLLDKVDLMDKIAIKLDLPKTRVTKNWKYFARLLGIKNDELDLIERGNNPAEQLLQHVYRTLPPEKKSAGEFRRIIMGFDNRPDLKTFVTDLRIENNNDSRPLISIIQPDSKEMREVTYLLNKSTGGIKNWRTLAREWELDYSVYDTFDPPSRPSPTGTLLDWMCINSHVSVEVFLNILDEKMKRYDIKDELEKIIQN